MVVYHGSNVVVTEPKILKPNRELDFGNGFYTTTNANKMGRDDLLTLAQYGLVCCEELDTMGNKELNQLKAAVTMPSASQNSTPMPLSPWAAMTTPCTCVSGMMAS